MKMNKRLEGSQKEDLAAVHLQEQGMRIVERNFRCRQGEIDIIGYENGYLVFVEVKYRRTGKSGNAAEAVGLQKQKVICRTADFYRYLHRKGEDTAVRYDVVAIDGERIRWIRNAFPHWGGI